MGSTESITTRRALMKGVAWAAPVAAVAITAPALAASPPVGPSPVIAVLNTNASCKVTGGIHKYRLVFTFTNSGSPVTFPVSDEAPFSLPASGEEVVTYESVKADDMANGTATATFEYRDATGVLQTVTQEFAVPSLSPCKG